MCIRDRGNGDHTANLAEPEGNQAWCMGAIDTDYSWETVAQTPTNLRTENQTENSFDILWDGTNGNTWSVELSANGQVVDTKTRLTEKKASFSNLCLLYTSLHTLLYSASMKR